MCLTERLRESFQKPSGPPFSHLQKWFHRMTCPYCPLLYFFLLGRMCCDLDVLRTVMMVTLINNEQHFTIDFWAKSIWKGLWVSSKVRGAGKASYCKIIFRARLEDALMLIQCLQLNSTISNVATLHVPLFSARSEESKGTLSFTDVQSFSRKCHILVSFSLFSTREIT